MQEVLGCNSKAEGLNPVGRPMRLLQRNLRCVLTHA